MVVQSTSVDLPASHEANSVTPVFDALCTANDVPQSLLCSFLHRLQQPWPSCDIMCMRVPPCLCCSWLPASFDDPADVALTLIECVIPKSNWCFVNYPARMSVRISDAKRVGRRLIVADVREWVWRDVNKLLRLVQCNAAARQMHLVVVVAANYPMQECKGQPIREGGLLLQPLGFAALQDANPRLLAQEATAIAARCSQVELRKSQEWVSAYISNQRALMGLGTGELN